MSVGGSVGDCFTRISAVETLAARPAAIEGRKFAFVGRKSSRSGVPGRKRQHPRETGQLQRAIDC